MLSKSRRQTAKLLLGMIAITGIYILVSFLRLPSEPENQFLFGLSQKRLALGMVLFVILVMNIGAVFWLGSNPKDWQIDIEDKVNAWITNHIEFGMVTLYFTTLATGLLLLVVFQPASRAFKFFEPLRELLGGPALWLAFSSLLLTIFFKVNYGELIRKDKFMMAVDHFLLAAFVFLTIFYSYKHLLIWMSAGNQPSYTYWNLLADEFLKGKLYLENPVQNHDLTLYQGKWFVPMPPLPAILMLPQAFLFGGQNINTSNFSIFFSAINAVLVFLILEQLVRRKWIKLSPLPVSLLLLVALFAFGNPHLWVGIMGRAWFVSQIVSVTFLALAVLTALKSWSPWLVGISLGLAIAARPNGIMTWPFVFAIAMQIIKEEGGAIDWKKILNWSVKSLLPMGVAVTGLLVYNYARFENFFDFGYTTIKGDPGIVANAQTYGIFSTHYILTNIKVMLFYFPAIQPGYQWPVLPSTTGMSIFLVTPPLIYLFRRYERKWWITGAWVSVLFNFALLVLYHNTGAHQFGYRYILDVSVPLIMLLATALGKKLSWHFMILLLFSILFNIYGAYWFITG